MKAKLTPKQAKFCREYMVDLNATQAAIRAGYSKKTANVIGPENLAKPCIQALIANATAKQAEKTGITAENVLRELALLAYSNMGDYAGYGANGVKVTPTEELTRDQMACIAEVGENITRASRTTKFKLHDKKGSLELLGKHLGLFPNRDKTEHSGEVKHDVHIHKC